jgi:hypothetical protein
MHQFIRVLRKFTIVKLLKFVDGELERVDFSLELRHELLGVAGLTKFEDLVVEQHTLFLLLDLEFLLDVAFIGSLLSDVLVHKELRFHG